jgi:hypothetical protein
MKKCVLTRVVSTLEFLAIIQSNRSFIESDHISPEQPYRLNTGNLSQNTIDNPGDIYIDANHVSPCISPEENTKNRAQNEQLRRSGDAGDIGSQRIISIIIIIVTQFLILWHMISNIPFLQLFAFRIFPISIVIRPMH